MPNLIVLDDEDSDEQVNNNSTENPDLAPLRTELNDRPIFGRINYRTRRQPDLINSGTTDSSGVQSEVKPRSFSADQALLRRDSAINLAISSSDGTSSTTTSSSTSSSMSSISRLKRQQKAANAAATGDDKDLGMFIS